MTWMQRLYHAVTCTDATCDPSCVIGDPSEPGGLLCPRVATESWSAPRTLTR